MKIERMYDGNIEFGIIKSNGVTLGNYMMPDWDDINSVGFIDIAYKDYLVTIIIPCALDKRSFIPYGKITKINRRKNTLLSYIILDFNYSNITSISSQYSSGTSSPKILYKVSNFVFK